MRFSLDCRMHLGQPNEHILHHHRGCGGLANILDVMHRAKRSCLLICYLYPAQLNLFGKKKTLQDANTGSAVGSEYLLIKKVRKTPLIILIDSFRHIYTLVFVQVSYMVRFWQSVTVSRWQPGANAMSLGMSFGHPSPCQELSCQQRPVCRSPAPQG